MEKLRLCLHYETARTQLEIAQVALAHRSLRWCLCGGGRKHMVEMLSDPEPPHPGETLARSEERQCRVLP